mgnify:CR=1 FL=1
MLVEVWAWCVVGAVSCLGRWLQGSVQVVVSILTQCFRIGAEGGQRVVNVWLACSPVVFVVGGSVVSAWSTSEERRVREEWTSRR